MFISTQSAAEPPALTGTSVFPPPIFKKHGGRRGRENVRAGGRRPSVGCDTVVACMDSHQSCDYLYETELFRTLAWRSGERGSTLTRGFRGRQWLLGLMGRDILFSNVAIQDSVSNTSKTHCVLG